MEKFISWVEIPATNLERAVTFYNAVLKADLQIADFGEEKMACFPNGEGAITQAKGFKPSLDGAIVSFNTGEDIAGALERAEGNGGEMVLDKTEIESENSGFFALIKDTEGNKVGLYGNK